MRERTRQALLRHLTITIFVAVMLAFGAITVTASSIGFGGGGGGGSSATWAQVLANGSISGGTNPEISFGDSLEIITASNPGFITAITDTFGNPGVAIQGNGGGTSSFTVQGAHFNATGTDLAFAVGPNYSDGGTNSSTFAEVTLINPIINYTGAVRSGHYEALTINPTETSLPSGVNYLVRAEQGGTDRFKVQNTGFTTVATSGASVIYATNNIAATPFGQGIDLVMDGAQAVFSTTAYGVNDNPAFLGIHARGSVASPSASQTGDILSQLTAHGYGATGFSATSRGKLSIVAAENWSDTAQGTYLQGFITATGTTTPIQSLLVQVDRTAIGYTSVVGAANTTAVGVQAAAAQAYDTVMGFQAETSSGSGTNTVYGALSVAGGAGSIVLGVNATDSNHSNVVVMTQNATTTASNQFVCGGPVATISDVYFGNGAASATPLGYTIHAPGGSGSNVAAVDSLSLSGGQGTGTGHGGPVVLRYAPAGSSSSSLNALVDGFVFSGVDGGITVGMPTGGDKGAGTINVSGNFYVNGVLVGGGGTTYPVAPSGGTYTTSATGTNSVALGDTASANDNTSIVAGHNAISSGGGSLNNGGNVVIGNGASVTGSGLGTRSNIVIGVNASAGGNGILNCIAIGPASLNNFSQSICLGTGSTSTASGQFVCSTSIGITDIYFGLGVTNTSAVAVLVHGTGGSGADNPGGSVGLAGGIGTGTGVGGNVLVQYAPPGSSSSTPNSLTTSTAFSGTDGTVTVTPGASTSAAVHITSNSSSSGAVSCLLLTSAVPAGTAACFDIEAPAAINIGVGGTTTQGISITMAAGTNIAFETQIVASDNNGRTTIFGSGAHAWSSGSASNDVFLYRAAGNTLALGTAVNNTAGLLELGKITSYGSVATVGQGVVPVYGLDFRQAVTSADGAPITLYTAVNGTSVFRITADIFATAFTSGTATYTIAWTQNGSAQTLVVNATALNTLGTATDLINPDNGTAITSRVTGTFSASLTVTGSVEQIK